MQGLRKIMKNISQVKWCPGQHSNVTPSKYKHSVTATNQLGVWWWHWQQMCSIQQTPYLGLCYLGGLRSNCLAEGHGIVHYSLFSTTLRILLPSSVRHICNIHSTNPQLKKTALIIPHSKKNKLHTKGI
jgi:hypothetical protein